MGQAARWVNDAGWCHGKRILWQFSKEKKTIMQLTGNISDKLRRFRWHAINYLMGYTPGVGWLVGWLVGNRAKTVVHCIKQWGTAVPARALSRTNHLNASTGSCFFNLLEGWTEKVGAWCDGTSLRLLSAYCVEKCLHRWHISRICNETEISKTNIEFCVWINNYIHKNYGK